LQRVPCPEELKQHENKPILNYIVAVVGIMDNGNDPPAHTINLEFSGEKHAITK